MTSFFLVRHGMTDSVGKIISGRQNGIHLNAEGIAQAEELADRFKNLSVDAIYSSPLERAVETAIPVANLFGVQNTVCEDFHEIDFGDWTGKTIEELRGLSSFQRFNSFRSVSRIPGGESMPEAQVRITRGLEKLRCVHEGQRVLVVSHADLIKAAVAFYAGIHLDMFERIEISPASVTIIEIYDETARILAINNTGDIKNLFHK